MPWYVLVLCCAVAIAFGEAVVFFVVANWFTIYVLPFMFGMVAYAVGWQLSGDDD